MEYRYLGNSGFKVPVLSFGTATFGGQGFFRAWGTSDLEEARRLVDLCMDAGVNFFDSADIYSYGMSEEILGEAIAGRPRDSIILSTKATFRMSDDPNEIGSSRYHLLRSCERSLRRLKTDYIDIYFLHGFDAKTAVEDVLKTLDTLVTSGKVRYIGCSNFSGWHLMKSLAISEKYGWARYVVHQAHYSLLWREYEWELMPLALDQGVGTMVWSPLAGGRLGGRYRRGQPIPANGRLQQGGGEGPSYPEAWFYSLIDVLDAIAAETGKTVAQIALNWLTQRPTVANVCIGARSEAQLRENLGAVGWSLTAEQIERLDRASQRDLIYPYWHQRNFTERNPSATVEY